MLVVSRRNGESVYLGDNIKVTVVEIKGSRIRIGVEAGEETFILRAEKRDEQESSEPCERRLAKAA